MAANYEQFLLAHGFHREERDIYSRRYVSLKEASRDLGFEIGSLRIPPNGPGLDVEDLRVCMLGRWQFVVTADKGHTLDDPNTPCTVGTALFQVPAEKEPKGSSFNKRMQRIVQ